MTPLLRRGACVRPRVRTASAVNRRHGDRRWPSADPDDAIAVGYLDTYDQHTGVPRHPHRTEANRLLRCLLSGAR